MEDTRLSAKDGSDPLTEEQNGPEPKFHESYGNLKSPNVSTHKLVIEARCLSKLNNLYGDTCGQGNSV